MATIYKSKYTGEQIELLLGDVETLKGVNLGQQTSETPFTIDEDTKQILFGETPPIITVQIDGVNVNLYRIAMNTTKAYYTNTIEYSGVTYFITIVVNSNLQCEIKPTRQLVIPQPTEQDGGKILKVNAVGNGFELVEVEDAITFANETQVDRLFNGLLGTWYFYPTLSLYYLTPGTTYNISFKSFNKNYVGIKSEAYGPSTRYGSLKYVDSNGTETVVYKSETSTSWVDEGYKSVEITETSLSETEYNSVLNFFTNSTLPPDEHKPISIDNLKEFKQKCDETYAPIGGATEVVANNGEPTTETLQTLKVDDTNYKIPLGTTVVANPTLSGSEAELTGLEVAGTKYKVPQGGGGIVAVDSLPTPIQTEYEKHLLYLYNGELYYLSSATQYKLVTVTNYVADELLGTWVFNESITANFDSTVISTKAPPQGTTIEFLLNFQSNLSDYKQFAVVYNGSYIIAVYYDNSPDTVGYDSTAFEGIWMDEAYRTITITDTSSLTNREEFTTWLKANAVKQ